MQAKLPLNYAPFGAKMNRSRFSVSAYVTARTPRYIVLIRKLGARNATAIQAPGCCDGQLIILGASSVQEFCGIDNPEWH